MAGNSAIEQISCALVSVGYRRDLILRDYTYADLIDPRSKAIRIPLAAFAQSPTTYRNACIGVICSDGFPNPENVIKHKSLGAPLILEICSTYVARWKITESGPPAFIDKIQSTKVIDVIRKDSARLNPDTIFRAKNLPEGPQTIQLDFVDAGVMSFLEGIIHKKLDNFLHDAVRQSIKIHSTHFRKKPALKDLFRLLLKFVAAKVLRDRDQKGSWNSASPEEILDSIEDYYGRQSMIPEDSSLRNSDILAEIWGIFLSAFHFQNLAVDDLAFIYENTFVTREARRTFGTHSTPPQIAEYIVRRLPFESLDNQHRRVLEPCSGHGIFLISAMRRLKELMAEAADKQRLHRYLVGNLTGIEIDTFACEVSRLTLMLADYPNPDGWNISNEDIFTSDHLEQELSRANVVLCNPPFENFNAQEREKYSGRFVYIQKPAELLRRILYKPPDLLGIVLPRVFLTGSSYRALRLRLAECYRQIELVSLPDRVFTHSDMETSLLMTYDRNEKNQRLISTSREVSDSNRKAFLEGRFNPHGSTQIIDLAQEKAGAFSLWIPRLSRVWKYLDEFPKLGDSIDIHRGIEWSIPTYGPRRRKNRDFVITDHPGKNLFAGIDTSKGGILQFFLIRKVYLRIQEDLMRGNSHKLPWKKSKVLANATRLRRGPWRIAAAVDDSGLMATQAFHAIWPKPNLSPSLIAALLNSPVANAFIYLSEGQRSNKIKTIRKIPIPPAACLVRSRVESTVKVFEEIIKANRGLRNIMLDDNIATGALLQVDAAILKAYDLPPAIERELLDIFQGIKRPLPFKFDGYYPDGFQSFIPLYELISQEFDDAKVEKFLKRFKPINDEKISEMFSWLNEDI